MSSVFHRIPKRNLPVAVKGEGMYIIDKDGKRYQYATANATGKQTLSPTEVPTTSTITFKDWDGTIIAEYTDDIGTALTAPTNPTRTG